MARPRWLMRRTVFACSLAFLPPAICIAQQKSDSELFAEGRIALDKYKDCPTAITSFQAESEAAKGSPIWLDYAARASECVGDLNAALAYYERELNKMPGTARLIDKVGDLQYRIKAKADEAAIANAKQLEQSRQEAEQSKQQAALHSPDGPSLQQTIDYINSRGFGATVSVSFENSSLSIVHQDGDDCGRFCSLYIKIIPFKEIAGLRIHGAVVYCARGTKCIQSKNMTKKKNKIISQSDGWAGGAGFFAGAPDQDQEQRLGNAVQRLLALLEDRYAAETKQKTSTDPFR